MYPDGFNAVDNTKLFPIQLLVIPAVHLPHWELIGIWYPFNVFKTKIPELS